MENAEREFFERQWQKFRSTKEKKSHLKTIRREMLQFTRVKLSGFGIVGEKTESYAVIDKANRRWSRGELDC